MEGGMNDLKAKHSTEIKINDSDLEALIGLEKAKKKKLKFREADFNLKEVIDIIVRSYEIFVKSEYSDNETVMEVKDNKKWKLRKNILNIVKYNTDILEFAFNLISLGDDKSTKKNYLSASDEYLNIISEIKEDIGKIDKPVGYISLLSKISAYFVGSHKDILQILDDYWCKSKGEKSADRVHALLGIPYNVKFRIIKDVVESASKIENFDKIKKYLEKRVDAEIFKHMSVPC